MQSVNHRATQWSRQPPEVQTERQNGEESESSDSECGKVVGISETADVLGFFPHNRGFQRFTENRTKKIKYAVSSSSLGENTSLISEVREEYPDCFRLIAKQESMQITTR